MPVTTTWGNPAAAVGSGGLDQATDNVIDETYLDRVASDIYRLGGTAGNAKTGPYQIGSTTAFSNAQMTQGLTINQDANDDQVLAFKSSDVAHGMTSQVETDTYGHFDKVAGADGGVRLRGLTETTIAVRIWGSSTTEDTTKSAAGVACVEVLCGTKSGTTEANPGANVNLFAVRNVSGNTKAIIDSDGDLGLDAVANQNQWDDYDDVALLEAFRAKTAGLDFKHRLAEEVERHAAVLAATGVLHLNADGHHFVSLKGFMGLMIDAVRQTNQRLSARLEALEQRTGLLPG